MPPYQRTRSDRLERPIPHPAFHNVDVACSRFCGAQGVEEINYILRPTQIASLADQLDGIESALEESLQRAGLTAANMVFRRYFCSDLPNQAAELSSRGIYACGLCDTGAVSLVNQPPQPPAKVSLWVYCLRDPRGALQFRRNGNSCLLIRGSLQHAWTTGIAVPSPEGSHVQTRRILDKYTLN